MATIVNIVLIGRVEGVDFEEVREISTSRRKKRGHFTGLPVKLPKCTCLMFPNGSVTVVGLKSINDIHCISFHLSCIFPNSSIHSLQICNIVATINVGRKISIPSLYETIRGTKTRGIIYTPETFPGMTIPLDNKMVVVVFQSGKANITGARSIEELRRGEQLFWTMINDYNMQENQ